MSKRVVLFVVAVNLLGTPPALGPCGRAIGWRFPGARGVSRGWTSAKHRRELRSSCTC